MKDDYSVMPIPAEQTYEWLLKKHYAHTIPSISYSFGLYKNNIPVGCITFGYPPSQNLKSGIAGSKFKNIVIELNRLVIEEGHHKNCASFLVGSSIRALPKPLIIVSFADTKMGHVGFVYQATNFFYTGLSAKRTNWKVRGLENLHSFTIGDISRGEKNRAEFMRKKYGGDFYLEERSRKHRYIYIHANKKDYWNILNNFNYEIIPYPKGDSKRYNTNIDISVQGALSI